jgi:hypothetical protein
MNEDNANRDREAEERKAMAERELQRRSRAYDALMARLERCDWLADWQIRDVLRGTE